VISCGSHILYARTAENMILVMDFLEHHTLLDHELVGKGIVSKDIAKGLGEFMGKTHSTTHSSIVSKERYEYLVHKFENRSMRDIQLEFVFTKCYKEATDEQRAGLNVDENFMKEVEELKAAYNGDIKDHFSLCHGDLHPGSVMVYGGDVKVIDPEFSIYGPPGLDVGSLLSGFVLGAVHQAFCGNNEAVDAIIEEVHAIWVSYSNEMKKGGISEEILAKIEAETVGFTVAEVCRTALEFAGGRKWLQFDDNELRAKARKAALKIVEKCMINRHTEGMKLLVGSIKEYAKYY
jgi:5-methylthioribose kinase